MQPQTKEPRTNLVYPENDHLLRMTLMGGQARVLMCRATRLTQQAADIHQASDVATTAMGRMLSAGAMLSCLMDLPQGSLTATAAGDGVGGRITVVASGGDLKIAVANPQAELPLRADGRQDVAAFVGKGQLSVVKDLGKGEPSIGISDMRSGELGEDFARYFTTSEQTPSLVALGCLNQAGTVLSAGGILIQAMPGCTNQVIEQLEIREPFFSNISREIYDRSLRQLADAWFEGLEPVIVGEYPLRLHCNCAARMERALLALPRADLEELAFSGEDTVMTCHFCRSAYSFTPAHIRSLLQGADFEDAK